jgi:hypothetical protein
MGSLRFCKASQIGFGSHDKGGIASLWNRCIKESAELKKQYHAVGSSLSAQQTFKKRWAMQKFKADSETTTFTEESEDMQAMTGEHLNLAQLIFECKGKTAGMNYMLAAIAHHRQNKKFRGEFDYVSFNAWTRQWEFLYIRRVVGTASRKKHAIEQRMTRLASAPALALDDAAAEDDAWEEPGAYEDDAWEEPGADKDNSWCKGGKRKKGTKRKLLSKKGKRRKAREEEAAKQEAEDKGKKKRKDGKDGKGKASGKADKGKQTPAVDPTPTKKLKKGKHAYTTDGSEAAPEDADPIAREEAPIVGRQDREAQGHEDSIRRGSFDVF